MSNKENRGINIKKAKEAKGLEIKYVFRRVLLVILITGLLIGGSVYFGYVMASRGTVEKTPQESAVDSRPEAPSSSEDTSMSESSKDGGENSGEVKPVKVDAGEWNMLLVNKQHILPDYYDVELVKVVDEYRVDKRIEEPLLRMLAGAKEDGITLMICSAYRSPEYQAELFEKKKNELMANGAKEEDAIAVTATIITNPGTSEHHTGLAVDIVTPEYQSLDDGFEKTPAFGWLKDNAAKYGFIMRYPKDKQEITEIIYEPWHYRYVGIEAAAEINGLGLCLEEYIGMLREDTALNEPGADEESSESE